MFSRAKMFMCVVGDARTMRLSRRKKVFFELKAVSQQVTPKKMQFLLEVWVGGRG